MLHQIYTLAESGTTISGNGAANAQMVINGKGTDRTDTAAMKGRAKRKSLTQKLMLGLITVAEFKGDAKRIKAYWNTYHCQETLFTSEGRVFGKYCKNRFCPLCASIRKAEIINRYLPVIETWEDPHFVTLTVKSVPAGKLEWLLNGIKKAFKQITGKYKKQDQRGKGQKLVGIKSLECNFNPVKLTYNPHLHIVVQNEEMAQILIDEWLKKWTKKYALREPQDMRKVSNKTAVLVEVIKYSAKIFTDPDMGKGEKKIPPQVYLAALDTIFTALQGYHLFDRFGFNLPPVEAEHKETSLSIKQCEEWIFHLRLNDWLNEATGELLTGFVPSSGLRLLLGQHFDIYLQ